MTGEDFRLWRKQKQMTQGQIAALLGVHEDTVANWERERTPVPKSIELTVSLMSQKKNRRTAFKDL